MQVYRGDWNSKEDLLSDFRIHASELEGCTVLYAWYEYADYSGSAFVLYKKGDKLFEVNGGHCSCYGLEGQWEPEETFVDAISVRSYSGIDEETARDLRALLQSV